MNSEVISALVASLRKKFQTISPQRSDERRGKTDALYGVVIFLKPDEAIFEVANSFFILLLV